MLWRGTPSLPRLRHHPSIGLANTAGQHRPVGPDLLTNELQIDVVQPAERGQVGAREGSVRHVEVLLMAS